MTIARCCLYLDSAARERTFNAAPLRDVDVEYYLYANVHEYAHFALVSAARIIDFLAFDSFEATLSTRLTVHFIHPNGLWTIL